MLICLLLCQCGYFVSHAIYVDLPLSPTINGINTLIFGGWEVFYLWTGWTRSYDVFHVTSSPLMLRIVKGILLATTVTCFTPFLAFIIPTSSSETRELALLLTNIICGTGVVAVDTFFGWSYVIYIFRRTVETVELKGPEVQAALMALSTLCLFVVFTTLATGTDQSGFETYVLVMVLVDVCIFCISLPLVLMKIRLTLIKREK
ncbi:hypothetical protein BDR26DRAFT_855873 [Obelidium mucronatum]|nr:hypothetical protein BDR26DRAFT_855873 [Obelidium mucronatum]